MKETRERLTPEFVKERIAVEREKARAVDRLADAMYELAETIGDLNLGNQRVVGRALNNLAVSLVRRGRK